MSPLLLNKRTLKYTSQFYLKKQNLYHKETYLEPGQTSIIEVFAETSSQLVAEAVAKSVFNHSNNNVFIPYFLFLKYNLFEIKKCNF